MKNPKITWSLISVVAITWVVAFWYEPRLPEQIPTHWNSQGEVDGYMSKPWGVYLLPILSLVSSALLMWLPQIAPKGFKLNQARKVYDLLLLVLAVFYLGIMVLTFEAGMNRAIDINQWVMVGMGSLFLIIGNYLSKVPKNFFLGIRTPWTLSSDEVWYKTHRLGSWTFILSGLLAIVGGLLHWPVWLLITVISAAALIPVIYSLVVYKQIEGFEEDE